MSLAYLDVTELKTERADQGKSLRWVESVLAWYMSSPTSTLPSDNNNVVTPNVGVGRWLKQNSAVNEQNLTSQVITTNTTVVTGTKNYCNPSSGSITITLPASPVTGSIVSIYALPGTGAENKIIIDRNGNNLAGVAENKEIILVGDFVDLEFIAGYGWLVKGQSNNQVLRPITAVSLTLYSTPVAPALLSTPVYNGMIDYLGKQKNTTTYLNPSSTHSGTRTKRISLASDADAQNGTPIAQLSPLFNQNPNNTDLHFNYSPVRLFSPSILIDFGVNCSARISTIQYSIPTVNSRWASSRPRFLKVWGANNLDATFFALDVININIELMNCFSDLSLLYYNKTQDNAANWNLVSSNYHALLPINSLKFYRYYLIKSIGQTTANVNSHYLMFNQLEFFGDILTP